MAGKYDIHETDENFDRTLELFELSFLSPKNKQILREFIRDAGEGLHNPEKDCVCPVGKRKLIPYIYYLQKWTVSLGKDWTHVTTEDIRKMILDLRDNKIVCSQKSRKPYKESTKVHMRGLLKIFLRWLCYKNNVSVKYGFIDVRKVRSKLPEYLEKSQVEKLVLATNNTMYKAIIMLLFDAGLRIEEALNVKIKDLNYVDTPNGNKLLRVDVRISKTEARNLELFLAQEYVESWLRIHLNRTDGESYLFIAKNGTPQSYDALRIYFKKLAKKVLPEIRVYPHLFRHSSATYYASRLNRQQLCLRYGWAFSSPMPDIYIRRAGVDNASVVKQFEAQNINDLKKQNENLQEQMKILAAKMNELADAKLQTDAFLLRLMRNPGLQKALPKAVIEEGLETQVFQENASK